jgi:uncharacterized membrane protein
MTMKQLKKPVNSPKIAPGIKKCKNCRIIRTFLLAVLFVVLLGLIKSDQLHYLKIITPTNAAIFIIGLGCILFIFKIIKHLLEKK